MTRTLITGVNGFVGGHLARHLVELGETVVGVGRGDPSATTQALRECGLSYHTCSLDTHELRALLESTQPDTIVHSAFARTATSYETNVVGTSSLLDAVASSTRSIRVVIVSSSAIYGESRTRSPVTEESPVRPVTPYGVSKAVADLTARQVFEATGLPIMRARLFNIIGPGQRGDYLTAVCARQLAEIERGTRRSLALGNLESYRDFLDVRDLVRAIVAIAERGESGEAYNVCSGEGVAVRSVVDRMIGFATATVTLEKALVASDASDVTFQAGSFAKLRARTGWSPAMPLEQSLRDILDDWRRSL
jgi:GDP-4-dehydro-6-deoxy-D-mannose reductase